MSIYIALENFSEFERYPELVKKALRSNGEHSIKVDDKPPGLNVDNVILDKKLYGDNSEASHYKIFLEATSPQGLKYTWRKNLFWVHEIDVLKDLDQFKSYMSAVLFLKLKRDLIAVLKLEIDRVSDEINQYKIKLDEYIDRKNESNNKIIELIEFLESETPSCESK